MCMCYEIALGDIEINCLDGYENLNLGDLVVASYIRKGDHTRFKNRYYFISSYGSLTRSTDILVPNIVKTDRIVDGRKLANIPNNTYIEIKGRMTGLERFYDGTFKGTKNPSKFKNDYKERNENNIYYTAHVTIQIGQEVIKCKILHNECCKFFEISKNDFQTPYNLILENVNHSCQGKIYGWVKKADQNTYVLLNGKYIKNNKNK